MFYTEAIRKRLRVLFSRVSCDKLIFMFLHTPLNYIGDPILNHLLTIDYYFILYQPSVCLGASP